MTGTSILADCDRCTVGGMALAAQDKYAVQVPGGLRGYEDWQTVSLSQTEGALAVILANPVMIDAYRAGVPDNGKPFPDGSKMAKSCPSRA